MTSSDRDQNEVAASADDVAQAAGEAVKAAMLDLMRAGQPPGLVLTGALAEVIGAVAAMLGDEVAFDLCRQAADRFGGEIVAKAKLAAVTPAGRA